MASAANVVDALRGMQGTRRFLFLGAAAAVIVVVWLVGQWASKPAYVPLYGELEYKDAAEIADHLEKAEVPHELGAGGTQILVPVTELARARVALAKDGVAGRGRPGLELFDKASWGMTDFTQRVTFQRAMEGELARTIAGIRGIESAQVHLNLPAPSALRSRQQQAGASVVLALEPGVSLTTDAVDGITYVVSNSVEHLSPENVAVMDATGRLLSIPAAGGIAAGLSSRQLTVQRSVEDHLAQKIERMLETVVGAGRARAQVAAQLSFDQVDRTIDTFDPDTQVLQNEQRSETEGGAAGTQTIVSNAYQNSRRIEKIIGSVGNIVRLTVAVLIDAEAMSGAATASGGGATPTPVAVEDIEAMVRDAVGIDVARGDRVSVKTVPFEPVAVPEAALAAATSNAKPPVDVIGTAERLSRPIIGLVAILALVLLALRAMKSPSAPAGAPTPGLAQGPGPRGELTAAEVRNGGTPSHDATADVLRNWLAESKS